MYEMKNILDGINSRLDIAKDKTEELEGTVKGPIQDETEKNAKTKQYKELWEQLQVVYYMNTWNPQIGFEERKGKIFKEIIAENFPNLRKITNPQIKKFNKHKT